MTRRGFSTILNRMVYYYDNPLDRVFSALSDPTRRAIVDRLSREGPLAIGQLAAPFAMSLPAVMKHVGVLAEAGIVARTKTGRTVLCRLTPDPMASAHAWLEHYAEFWTKRLDALDRYLDEEDGQ